VRTVSGEGPRGLDSQPAETPVTKIRSPRRSIPDKTSSVVDPAPNLVDVALVTFATILLLDESAHALRYKGVAYAGVFSRPAASVGAVAQ
jgi:hypothetical protein